MRLALKSMLALAALMAWPASATAQVHLTPFANLSAPRHVAAPPGDYERVFVVQSKGVIRVVKGGVLLPEPFLDIEDEVSQVGEGGMASMAFAPDYAESGRFYVYYALDNGAANTCDDSADDPEVCPPIRVEEYRRSGIDPDRASPGSARELITIPHERYTIHYGGQLAFGTDGLLYVSTGDGDESVLARDPGSLLGKLLRIDPATRGAPEIWGLGLRNPFRFSFDSVTGDLLLADVGEASWEEVNRLPPGTAGPIDFAWPVCEGAHIFPPTTPPTPCATGLAPMFEYAYPSSGCASVIGGFVVRDPGLGSLLGRYVYADYCQDAVRSVAIPPAAGDPVQVVGNPPLNNPVSFGQDACGRIYVVQQGNAQQGPIWRLENATPAPCPPPTAPQTPGGSGEPAGSAGGQANGGAQTTIVDKHPPRFSLARKSPQRLGSNGLLVRLRCAEPCRLRAAASVSVPGAARTLRSLSLNRALVAGKTYNLRLKLTPGRRRSVRQALLAGLRVHAKVVARVRDDAGNLSVDRTRIRLVL